MEHSSILISEIFNILLSQGDNNFEGSFKIYLGFTLLVKKELKVSKESIGSTISSIMTL